MQNPLGPHVKRFLLQILAGAQRDGATELVIAPAAAGITYRYKVQDRWHEGSGNLVLDWPGVLSELAGLAGVRNAPFPRQGIIYVAYSGVRLRWQLKITSENEACMLRNLGTDCV